MKAGVGMGKALVFFGTFVFSFLQVCVSSAQSTRVSGAVRDAVTKVPVPFVNILIKNTFQGTITGEDGSFSIETRNKA
ncbi:MAG: carboxypeptidase-like regulatory domain-containing protein, partial [Flavobacteriales bacterium]|nr:carboxypeptidase-like regulatory domain-containing protein [Flavobacteriales bacterium]